MHSMGMRCEFAPDSVSLRSPRSYDQQRDAAGECHSPGEGRQRNGLLFVDRGLERAEVDHIFAGRVGDALIGKRHDAEHDEGEAENCCCFHVISFRIVVSGTQPACARSSGPSVSDGAAWALPPVTASRLARRSVEPAGQGQNEQDQENQTQSPAGVISPIGAVRPGGQRTNEQ